MQHNQTGYRESAQYQSFREKLNARGATVRSCGQAPLGDAIFEKLLIFRGEKPPVGAVIIDHRENGFAFYLATTSNKIDDDVEAIFAAD